LYDLVIRNALIVDGTGRPAFPGDVAIQGDRIVQVGACPDEARKTLDAAGLVVAPGFIDVHSHADHGRAGGLLKNPEALNFIAQGISTVIAGNCGVSLHPVGDNLDRLQRHGTAVNFGTLVGHGTLRNICMGSDERRPSRTEFSAMKGEVRRALDEGAFGLSTGLVYLPGAYADTDEIVALAREAAGGVYATHIRSEGAALFEAVQEALAVGEAAGLPVQISHIKCLGRSAWGQSGRLLRTIDAAVAGGVDVTCDGYPYDACFSTLANLMEPATLAEVARHRNGLPPDLRSRALRETEEALDDLGGPGAALIAECDWNSAVEGRRLGDVAAELRLPAAEAALTIVTNSRISSTIFFGMDPADVERLLCHPRVWVATDAGVQASGRSLCHPRGYGTFARVLQTLVRERGLLSLEEAVRKMTSGPADRFGLMGRGRITEGAFADLTVFDPLAVADTATYERPHATPVGVRWVVVNGRLAYDRQTGVVALAGRALRHIVADS
jgi:N-acyl-D-amino-acid deacylase